MEPQMQNGSGKKNVERSAQMTDKKMNAEIWGHTIMDGKVIQS